MEREAMIEVIAQKEGKRFIDYIKKSHLPRLIKLGYVVGMSTGSLTLEEAISLFEEEKIAVICDGDTKEIIFGLE